MHRLAEQWFDLAPDVLRQKCQEDNETGDFGRIDLDVEDKLMKIERAVHTNLLPAAKDLCSLHFEALPQLWPRPGGLLRCHIQGLGNGYFTFLFNPQLLLNLF